MRTLKHYQWSATVLLAVIATLDYGDRALVPAVLPLLRADLHMSDFMLGGLGSAFLWTYGICLPFSGYLADRVSRRGVIIWSILLWSLCTILTAAATTPGQMLLSRVLLGVTQCAFIPAATVLVAGLHPVASRGTAIGLQLSGYNLGFIVGGVGGGFFGDHFGWRAGFVIFGIAGIILAAVCVLLLRKENKEEQTYGSNVSCGPINVLRALVAVPSYLIVVAESSLISVSVWMLLSWLPLFFKERYNLSLTAAGFAGTFGLQTAATAAYIVGGYLSDRIAHRKRDRRMLLQSICFFVSIPFLAGFVLKLDIGMVSISIVLFAFFRSLGTINDNVIICEVLPSRMRGTALGISNSANSLAGGGAILIAGWLKAYFGLASVFAGLSFFTAMAGCLSLLGYARFLRRDLVDSAQSNS